MKFSLELSGIGRCNYRYQIDGSWRKLDEFGLHKDDKLFYNIQEIKNKSNVKNLHLDIDGEKFVVNKDEYIFPDDNNILHFSSRVFRNIYPELPSRKNLKEIISNGVDNEINVLILNNNSLFELRKCPPYNFKTNDPSVVVRHESFVPGNGYVGYEASMDEKFIDQCYLSSLKYWIEHIESGKTQFYCDMTPNADINILLKKAHEIKRRGSSCIIYSKS